MNYATKIISLLLILSFSSAEIKAENGVEKEILISCVSNKNAKEFSNYHLKYDPMMSTNNFTFQNGEIAKLKQLIGENEKISFFFLGYEDFLRKYSGRSFLIARENMLNTGATACTISYDYLCGISLLKKLQYFSAIENRVPKVVAMTSALIQNIVDSKEFKINLSDVYLTGFCLGGHIAGNVGSRLKKIYNGQMVPAIWAFDPPGIGFPYPIEVGQPERVQKGDGKFVVVVHTSSLGVLENIADVDVIVNYGRDQPGCENMFCDHFAAFILLENILLLNDALPKNQRGFPLAHSYDYASQFSFEITNPPSKQSGTYYLRTGKIFGNDK
ncbi:uncharacterized protein LOC116344113 [Contarinia nasturtii]|uniref:uncharacterized protein LOC116344113 n=1 Tax=Contarinia nasturtii TaxID=265458 RepID=UPI0012D37362|nr:uncharacterized protein LOC116344113 [Contarinia nasturtii]